MSYANADMNYSPNKGAAYTKAEDLRSREVEQLFNDPELRHEPFREFPITRCINIDNEKISNLSYFVCALSMFDAFSFALTFSLTAKLHKQEPYKWNYDYQLFA